MASGKKKINGDSEIMVILCACVTGVVFDVLFGDPQWLYHPVRLIGGWISWLEKRLLRAAGDSAGKQKVYGAILWFLVAVPSGLIPAMLLCFAEKIHPWLAFGLESFWCYQLLAARCLADESKKVYDCLKRRDIEGARRAVSMIVGRDTEGLDETGITKAAVETVAENTSDGVVAPLLFLMIGGAPFGFFYKAVNTMDSMIGYTNDTYLYFGRMAARMDDVMNYIPARISAVIMIGSAYFLGMDGKQAYRIYRRDRRKHASPNSAQTESVCAGALRVQLAGDAWYHGILHKKEYIGDDLRKTEAQDIIRAGRLMYGTMTGAVLIFGGVRFLFFLMV